jgi:peptide/nickel transport system substrate-binding protein
MKKRIFWLMLSCLMAISMLLASCGGDEDGETVTEEPVTEEPVTEEPVTEEPVTPAGGEWWDKYGVPQYGGVYTARATMETTRWEPYFGGGSTKWYETLAMVNFMGTDPDEFDTQESRFVPTKYMTGVIAESFETSDLQTYTFHIRKGIYWWDKPPVNGRELDAYDVEYSWHRQCGLGSGFDESNKSRYANMGLFGPPIAVEATDKWTVDITVSKPSLAYLRMIFGEHPYSAIVPREAVEEWGDLNDWTQVLGTGPFMVTDYVTSSSMTEVKNPNYWRYDEHYPENQLPYLDGIKTLIIPDSSTAIAALRTGKIDGLTGLDYQQAEVIRGTSPQLREEKRWSTAPGIYFPLETEPWNDIRVRKAFQMAIDLKTIGESYYGGLTDGTPVGHIGHDPYRAHYEDWPQEVKDGYAYNPEGAKALLAEAGYPNGLKCKLTARSVRDDMDLYQIIQAYLKDIGVDMEIEIFESTVWNDYVYAGKAELVTASRDPFFAVIKPVDRLLQMTQYHRDIIVTQNYDTVFEGLYQKAAGATNDEEQMKYCIDGDMYAISQQWCLIIQPTYTFNFHQPWVNRYIHTESAGQLYAYMYLDLDLKESMGYK